MGAPPADPAKYDADHSRLPARTGAQVRELLPHSAGGHALQRIGQPGDGDGGREVHQQVHMARLAVELAEFGAEVRAHVPHDLLRPFRMAGG
jgi:hypothetical protein